MKKGLTILLILILAYSCNQSIKFDSEKWKIKDDIEYPNRNKMLKDLTKNHNLVGVHYSEIIELLGIPQYEDSSRFSYQILHDYDSDIDPIYTKYLNFTLSKDSIVTSFKIDEWKK